MTREPSRRLFICFARFRLLVWWIRRSCIVILLEKKNEKQTVWNYRLDPLSPDEKKKNRIKAVQFIICCSRNGAFYRLSIATNIYDHLLIVVRVSRRRVYIMTYRKILFSNRARKKTKYKICSDRPLNLATYRTAVVPNRVLDKRLSETNRSIRSTYLQSVAKHRDTVSGILSHGLPVPWLTALIDSEFTTLIGPISMCK